MHIHACILVTVIRVRPSGHFIHISITTPIVSALKNYNIQSFLEAPPLAPRQVCVIAMSARAKTFGVIGDRHKIQRTAQLHYLKSRGVSKLIN